MAPQRIGGQPPRRHLRPGPSPSPRNPESQNLRWSTNISTGKAADDPQHERSLRLPRLAVATGAARLPDREVSPNLGA
jgi:hypothetical protein